MDAVVLCGGRGTRLAPVLQDLPKPLAPVNGRPFLNFILDHLIASERVTRIVLATGYLGEKVRNHYGDTYNGVPIAYSQEATALGTGGAVVNALRSLEISDPFFLLNGDSFADVQLDILFDQLADPTISFAMAVQAVPDAYRFGTVTMHGSYVTGFAEKTGLHKQDLINTGAYAVRHQAFDAWISSSNVVSLEVEILPALVASRRIVGLPSGSRFIDIGLPETYSLSEDFFRGRSIDQ